MEKATNLSRYLNLAKKNQEGNFIVKMKIHKLLQHLNFEMIMWKKYVIFIELA
jgi:hypothetical protein